MKKKIAPMIVTPYEERPVEKKPTPLSPEMAMRHKRALLQLLKAGDIDESTYHRKWREILHRMLV